MKKFSFALFCCVFLQCAAAQNVASSAKSYVQRAAEQMGGVEQLRAIKTLRIDYLGHRFMLEQSERPDGPFIVEYQSGTQLLNFATREVQEDSLTRTLGAEKGFPTSLTISSGVAQVKMGDKHRPGTPSQVVDANEALDYSAHRLVLAALDAADLKALPDATIHAETYHVVSFSQDHLPVRLYLNAFTGLPAVAEWTRAYPESIYWRAWGDVRNRHEFTNYSLLPGGIRLPSQTDLSRNGQASHSQLILKFDLNPQVADGAFAIAPEVKSAFEQRKTLMAEGPPLGKLSPLVEGDDSLVQFVGAWNCAVIKQSDGLVIIEAPIGPAHTKSLLSEAKKRFPGAPIKAVITTSDSWPHFAGVREVVAAGIPIYATDLNRAILTRFLNAPFTQNPDTLAKSPKQAKFTWVSQKTTIGTGPNRLEIYPMRNASGERMLMVYLPQHKLLYTSDLLQPGQDGPFFIMEYVREAADAAMREKLAVDRFFGMHMPLTPWTKVQEALAANASKALGMSSN